jgi:hypothetical protein
MPDISCSFTYFPSGSIANVHGSSKQMGFTAKGGGGFLINNMRQRPFIPIAGMEAPAPDNQFIYASVANNIAFMGDVVRTFFTAALNASVNYSTDNLAGADQLIIPVESFGSYLYKRVFSNTLMLDRYNYVANLVYNFWLYADAAWTPTQMFNAINAFKVQLVNNLADPNLFIAPNGYDFGALSVATAPIAAFKAADANLVAFDTVEIYTP